MARMAQPPLEHRIVVRATAAEGVYRVEEVLKGSREPRELSP